MRWTISLIVIALNLSTSIMANEIPKIVTMHGMSSIVLPKAFLSAIRRDYPGLRVPIEKDITGHWKLAIAGPHPYICWGDYDDNKLTDIAVILVSDTQWAFAIYHQHKDGLFILAYPKTSTNLIATSVELPQNHYVKTIEKGKPWIYSAHGAGLGYRFEKRDRYDFDNDVVEHGVFELSSALFYWVRDRYESFEYGD